MFDTELISVIVIFAGIAALIVYISERSKRRLKTRNVPLTLKKMPGANIQGAAEPASVEEASQPGPDLQEWNFPQPNHSNLAPTRAAVMPSPPKHADWRTPKATARTVHGLNTRAQLRATMINLAILGPCRAHAPFKDRE